MYKYKCAAAVNADKEDFYSVIDELKKLYPEMTDDNNAPSDSEFLRREFLQGKKRVMVQYSFSERSVNVFSEDWLGKFYEDRDVAEGRFPAYSDTALTGTMWKVSGAFFAVAAVISLFGFSIIFYSDDNAMLVIVLVLAAIYTVSGIIIRRSVDVPLLKLTFWQAGGFISVITGLVLLNLYMLGMHLPLNNQNAFLWYIPWIALIALEHLEFGFWACFPALEISFLIQAIIGLVTKKIHSSKSDAEKNIEENNK